MEINYPQVRRFVGNQAEQNMIIQNEKKLNLTFGFSFDGQKDVYCQKLLSAKYNTAPETSPRYTTELFGITAVFNNERMER